MKFATNPRH